MTTLTTLPLAALTESTYNPRKSFSAPKLQELADSIKATGLHQPILVRPLPGARVPDTAAGITHEIVAGARRYRACKLALGERGSIAAIVRELTDAQALEIAVIENLQRDDLTALEEAEGYQQLRDTSDLSAEDIGAKIGKSRAYVYARLKLLDLAPEPRQALLDGGKLIDDSTEWANTLHAAAAELRCLHDRVQELERERDNYKLAYDVWHAKTEWVQKTAQPHELGMHRADVLRERIERTNAHP